jgi:hypothetical protein
MVTSLPLDCLHQDDGRVSTAHLEDLSAEAWQALVAIARVQKVSALLYGRSDRADGPGPGRGAHRRSGRRAGTILNRRRVPIR